MPRKWFHPHAFLITVSIFAIIAALSQVHFRLHFLNPLSAPSDKDYDITDILYSQLLPRSAEPDSGIVLVNTGLQPDRARVATALQRILELEPRAVGVDILFEDRPSADPAADSLLRRAVEAYGDRIVLAMDRIADPEGKSYRPAPLLSGLDNGLSRPAFVNLPYYDPLATVRFFEPSCPGSEGDTLRAFAAELARICDPSAAARLEARGGRRERIHYTAGDDGFFVVQVADLLSDSTVVNEDLLRGKIVLVGHIGGGTVDEPFTDRHFTPMNPHYSGNTLPDLAGLALQANVLRMVLDGNYISEMPAWANVLLAFLACYASLLVLMRISARTHGFYHPLARLYQIVLIALLFVLIAWLYHAFRLHWDFSLGLTALALAVDGQLIYFAIVEALRRNPSGDGKASHGH